MLAHPQTCQRHQSPTLVKTLVFTEDIDERVFGYDYLTYLCHRLKSGEPNSKIIGKNVRKSYSLLTS